MALPGSVQLALHLPLTHTHTSRDEYTVHRNAIADQSPEILRGHVEVKFIFRAFFRFKIVVIKSFSEGDIVRQKIDGCGNL